MNRMRSLTVIASLCGVNPSMNEPVCSATVSTTSVSPSQCPVEYPGVSRIVQDLRRRLAPVQVHPAQRVVQLAEERDLVFRLHDFHAVRHAHHGGHARGQALGVVVELVRAGHPRLPHHFPLRHVLGRERGRVRRAALRAIRDRGGRRGPRRRSSPLRGSRRRRCRPLAPDRRGPVAPGNRHPRSPVAWSPLRSTPTCPGRQAAREPAHSVRRRSPR